MASNDDVTWRPNEGKRLKKRRQRHAEIGDSKCSDLRAWHVGLQRKRLFEWKYHESGGTGTDDL